MSSSLNPAQKQAVGYIKGPLLIVAGAGTGKTTVITRKITHLIESRLAKPEEILAVTFTEKSAAEMKTRVEGMLDIGYADLQISTFHAFCQKLLEDHALDIGLPNQFKLLTDVDAWLLMRHNLNKFNLDYYRPLGNPTRHIHELIKHFSKCKDELIAPVDYLRYAEEVKLDRDSETTKKHSKRSKNTRDYGGFDGQKEKEADIKRLMEAAEAYHAYNQLLLDNNALDFGDLIFYAVKLLEERPNVLQNLRQRFRYVLVDEFQDVNWAQYRLVQIIAGDDGQLTVVGDDDQSIYAFRGASISNILRFKEDYPQAKEVVLNKNYRSQQGILDAAYRLIQYNNPDRLETRLKIDKKLVANNDRVGQQAGRIISIACPSLDKETAFTAQQIGDLKLSDNCSWNDFAVLVRANSHAQPFIARLEQAGIPCEFLASTGLYRQPIVLDCFNFFKLLDNYHESTAVYRLLRLPCWNMPEEDMQKITNAAKRQTWSYYEALQKSVMLQLSATGMELASKLLQIIRSGSEAAKNSKPSIVLYHFLEQSGYLHYLTQVEENGDRQTIAQIHYLQQFFEQVTAFETTNPGAHLADFIEHYNYLLEAGDRGALAPTGDTMDSVKIMTVHSAKGLEFKYVFVVNLIEERFPTRARTEQIEIPLELVKEQLPEGDSHIEEERRLFYVAMTRAKEKLFLLHAQDYGGMRERKPSRFLAESGCLLGPCEKNTITKLVAKTISQQKGALPETETVYPLPAKFSFSQIKSYLTCPYQYKLAHIMRLPTRGNASFSFGQTLHSALQEFYRRLQGLATVRQDSLFAEPVTTSSQKQIKAPSLEELLQIYESVWINDWYADRAQRDGYRKKGIEILTEFYNSNQSEGWTIPLQLEGWFCVKLGPHLVHGRIDRVDHLADGSLNIIDYKTGQSKKVVSGDDKDQLLLYQLAAEQLPEYRNLGRVSKLTFYYLNDNSLVNFLGDDKALKEFTDKTITVIEKIKTRNFTATPSAFACEHCDFRGICDYRA